MTPDLFPDLPPQRKPEPEVVLPPAPVAKRFPRRKFIAGASLLTLGAGAAWLAFPKKRSDLKKVQEMILKPRSFEVNPDPKPKAQRRPQARVERTPLPGETDYRAFLASLDLRYISANEVISPHIHERRGVCNKLPPRQLWTRMATTLKVADELRHRLGVKMRYITSAYRCPAYNSILSGSASRSQHMQNRALDIVYDCSPRSAMTEALKMRDEGFFEGGLGLYSSFVHIDTRGRNATW